MTPADVARVMEDVYDPELGIDVVSLGLVYEIHCLPAEIDVRMGLTSADCPMGTAMLDMACTLLSLAFPDALVSVTLADSPPWDIAMADRSALFKLGIGTPTGRS